MKARVSLGFVVVLAACGETPTGPIGVPDRGDAAVDDAGRLQPDAGEALTDAGESELPFLIVPGALDFGTIAVGCRSRARSVQVYNTGAP